MVNYLHFLFVMKRLDKNFGYINIDGRDDFHDYVHH